MKRLYSIALLGLNFAGHWLRKLWPRKRGIDLFHEYYGPDRVGFFTTEDLARFPDFSKCVACGLCRAAMPDAAIAPSALPLAVSRTPTLAWTVREELANVPSWKAGEDVCPTHVPLGEIAEFVLGQANRTVPASAPNGPIRS